MTYTEKINAVEDLKYYVEDDGKIIAFTATLDQAFAIKDFLSKTWFDGKKPSDKIAVCGG
jgi:hypothetical protein